MELNQFPNAPDTPVLVVGTAGLDIVGRLRGELRLETSNPAQIRTSFGGVGRNVAENLARLGQPVSFITAVGDDDVGLQLIRQIREAGVDVSAAVSTPDWPTGTYLAAVNNKGHLQAALDDMRAINALTPEHLQQHANLFEEAALLFLDANLPKDTLKSALQLARRSRLPVVADPASASLAARLRPYLKHLRIVTPNTSEAAILLEGPVEPPRKLTALDAAKQLVGLGVEIAIVTMERFGVAYATSETSGQIPPIQTEIVDPTGAGDALTAAVIFALLNDIPLDDAVRLGVSAAALTMRCPGTVQEDLSLEKLYDQLVI